MITLNNIIDVLEVIFVHKIVKIVLPRLTIFITFCRQCVLDDFYVI